MLLPLLFVSSAAAQSWIAQPAVTTSSLRGVSAVNGQIAWASGTGGTYLLTTNGGAKWTAARVPGADELDFRDVEAFPKGVAYLLSSGPGALSRIYKTADNGKQWMLQFTNPDAGGFFDAMAFWDANHGIVVGDPVDGRFVILTTDDGGAHWQRRPTPPAKPKEGAFAASGTCVVVGTGHTAWFATGGPEGARVFRTADGGASWTVGATPIRNDNPSAGIFSIGLAGPGRGIAVGGDYSKPTETRQNIAITLDGGATWAAPSQAAPSGFRSAVTYLPAKKMWIAVGTSGSDLSTDDGATWKQFDNSAYNAISFTPSGEGWAVGPKGAVARFRP